MKFGTALAAALMVMTVAVASAQDGKAMKAKTAPGMRMAPMERPLSKAQWQKMYNEAEKMFAKRDADGIFKYMTPDFTMTSMGKTMNAEESKASMKQWFGMMKSLHASMTVTNAGGKGNMAMVTDSFKMSGMMMVPKSKKPAKFADWGTETATWVRMNGKWMMKKLVSNTEHMTVNGKPFDPSKMGG